MKISENNKGHYFKIGNKFVDDYSQILGSTTVSVYVVLKRHMHTKTRKCFPSIKRIASKTGLSERTVIRSVKRLQLLGFITKERVKTEHKYPHNIYSFNQSNNWLRFPKYSLLKVVNDNKSKNQMTPLHTNNTKFNKKAFSPKEKDPRTLEIMSRKIYLADLMKI